MTIYHPHISIPEMLAKRKRLDGMFAIGGQSLSNRDAREMLGKWPFPNFCGCDRLDSEGKCAGHES
jgi:hypothetical protein